MFIRVYFVVSARINNYFVFSIGCRNYEILKFFLDVTFCRCIKRWVFKVAKLFLNLKRNRRKITYNSEYCLPLYS